ncbi:MAG: hypothetical protein OEW19_20125 [Acidobacteriota bacterium]|nr:hypothetical protein [Acidobacteriota bacterium]
MLSDRRTWLVGGAIALALGSVAWTFFGPQPATPSARAPRGAGRRATVTSEAPLPVAESVRLAELAEQRDEPSEATRNPFQFGSRRAPTSETTSAAPVPVETLKPDNAPAAAVASQPQPIQLRFIGLVGLADGTTLAVLVSTKDDAPSPLHGKEGDIIDGRYRILKIGTESIELAYLDGRGRQTLRLSEQ